MNDPNQNLNLPVLIFLSKEGCRPCISYAEEWEKIKSQLQGKARFVRFSCNPQVPGRNPPPAFKKYMLPQDKSWYPTILLAGPKSYFRIFTPDDQINEDEYSDQYTIRAKKFNAIEIPGGYSYAGRSNTAENTILWFNQVIANINEFDESTPPRKFSHLF